MDCYSEDKIESWILSYELIVIQNYLNVFIIILV